MKLDTSLNYDPLHGIDCFTKTPLLGLKKNNYASTNHSKHYLKSPMIFVCKYRKKLLVGHLHNDMKSIMQSITSKSDFEIEVFESEVDPIHFLIRYIPRLSCYFHSSQIEAGNRYCNLAKPQKHIVKELLERTYLWVRWLLRLFYRRSKSRYCPSIYSFTRLNVSGALHPKSYRLLGFTACFIKLVDERLLLMGYPMPRRLILS